MTELPPEVVAIVDEAATKGDKLAEEGKFTEAIAAYRVGLAALPKGDWSASLWFHAAIGDAQFLARDYDEARITWMEAILDGGLGNPFIHLRRGQTMYELGNLDEAGNELLKALLIEGVDIFDESDPKYLDYVTGIAQPPAGREDWDDFQGLPPEHPALVRLLDPGMYELQTQ